MAFLPDGGILITERAGRLRIVRNGVLDPSPIAGLPQVQARGIGGLMDLALHPRFSENKLVYFTYDKPASNNSAEGEAQGGIITLARGRWDGTKLETSMTSFLPPRKAQSDRESSSAETACCT